MKRNRDILNYRISKGRNTVASIQLNLMWVKISLMLFHLKSVPIDCLKCHRAETNEPESWRFTTKIQAINLTCVSVICSWSEIFFLSLLPRYFCCSKTRSKCIICSSENDERDLTAFCTWLGLLLESKQMKKHN